MNMMLMGAASGLTNGKLSLADADTSEVLAGKKFYAGDKLIKTGTLDLAKADAEAGNVLVGKQFYAGDKTIKAGTMANNGAVTATLAPGGSYTIPAGYHNGTGKVTAYVPVFKLINEGSVTVMTAPRITLTVSGYSEYYCFHSDSNSSSLSWSASQGSFDGYTWTGNGCYIRLKGCNPSSGVTISALYNHDTGGYARYLKIFAIG